MLESLKTKVEHPSGLTFLLGDKAHNILVESLLYYFGMYVGSESELIFLLGNLLYIRVLLFFFFHEFILYRNIDRKSTRLNSSHANISYAVFCLKKKQYTTTI